MVLLRRHLLARIALFTMVPASIFGVAIIVIASDEFGLNFFENISRFLKGDPLGIALFIILCILTLIFFISLGLRIWEGERLRRLRYDLLSYLSRNRRIVMRKVPIEEIARSISRERHEVELALNVLIARREVKGRIDPQKGVYIHSSVTKKGQMLLRISAPRGKYGDHDGP